MSISVWYPYLLQTIGITMWSRIVYIAGCIMVGFGLGMMSSYRKKSANTKLAILMAVGLVLGIAAIAIWSQ